MRRIDIQPPADCFSMTEEEQLAPFRALVEQPRILFKVVELVAGAAR